MNLRKIYRLPSTVCDNSTSPVEWTVLDLADVLDRHKSNAQRRVTHWLTIGKILKVTAGKRGNGSELARYRFTNPTDTLYWF
jgi:hypothetical protein